MRRALSAAAIFAAGAALTGCTTATPAIGYQPAPGGVVVRWDTTSSANTTSAQEALAGACHLGVPVAQTTAGGRGGGAATSSYRVAGDRLTAADARCLQHSALVIGVYLPRHP